MSLHPVSRTLCLLALVGAVGADPAPQYWLDSQPEGRSVLRTGFYINWSPNGVRSSDGNLVLAWSDARTGNFDVHAQKLSAEDGLELWSQQGEPLLVSGAPDQQAQPLTIADDSGGAFVVWFDFRDGNGGGALYANRIGDGPGGTGTTLWAQDLEIHSGSHIDPEYIAGDLLGCTDDQGGFWLAWTDQRAGNWDLFLSHVDANGVIAAFSSDGMPIADDPAAQHSVRLLPDGAGGVWLGWIDERNGPDGDLFVEHVDSNGQRASGARGARVRGGAAIQQEPAIALAANGLWLAWTDRESDMLGDVRLQRVNTNLENQLAAEGLPVRSESGIRESAPALCSLPGGEVLVGWEDSRDEPSAVDADLRIQRVSPDGTFLLAAAGAALCSVPGNQFELELEWADGSVLALWRDQRFLPRSNLYAQKLNLNGQLQWQDTGMPLLEEEAQNRTSDPVILKDGQGGLQAFWFDEGHGAPGLRTQRLDGNGSTVLGERGQEISWGPAGELNKLRLVNTNSGLWSFWIESTTIAGNDRLCVQKVNPDTGDRQFAREGQVVAPDLDGRTQAYALLPAPDGGVYVGLELGESLGQRSWLLRLAPGGELLWSTPLTQTFDPSGDGSSYQQHLKLAFKDGNVLAGWSGIWNTNLSFHTDLGIQCISPTGSPLWGPDGVQLSATPNQSEDLEALLMNTAGEILFIHSLQQFADEMYYGLRLGPDGQPLALPLLEFATEPQRRRNLQACELADGGLALVWEVQEDDGRTTLRGKGYNPDFSPRWQQDFEDGVHSRVYTRVVADAWGGVVVSSLDYDAQFSQYAGLKHVLADGSLRWTEPGAVTQPQDGRETDPGTLILPAEESWTLAQALVQHGQEGEGDAIFLSAHRLDEADPQSLESLWGSSLFRTSELRTFLELALAPDGEGGYYAGWVEQIRLRTQCCTQPIRNVHLARVGTPLTSVEASDVLPQRLELRSWPNPFNPSTRLAFQLDRPGQVTLQVYNLQGRLVATLLQDSALGAGTHSMTWEADSRLASGTYLLQLAVGEQSTTRKVLLLR